MFRSIQFLSALVLTCPLALPVSAQWFSYPTQGIPRLKNGEPDLAAPAPHSAGGKPDLSGIWLHNNPLPCAAFMKDDSGECAEKIGLPPEAINMGASLPGGLPYRSWAADLVKKRKSELAKDDPHARCLPPNFPRAFSFPHMQEYVQSPRMIVILDEFNASFRQIFTDGRPLLKDPQPSWNGYSTGNWIGDTLVVETNGFRDDLWLDMNGSPLTNAAKVTERIRRPDFGHLEIEVTVDDPKAYTKPWTVQLKQKIVVDTDLLEEICLEGERSVEHLVGK